jgi:uncharacterized membrane protein
MSKPGPRGRFRAARTTGKSLYQYTVDVVLTGFAVIVPLVVTLYVLKAAYGVITDALDPFIRLLEYAGVISGVQSAPVFRLFVDAGIVEDQVALLTQITALVILAALIVGVGVVARHRYGERLIDYFDAVVMSVPGIGGVYKSFRRMSDVVMESDVSNFREVKIVEFPYDDTYVLGFVTNDSPPEVEESVEEPEMLTMFLPLAPNPFMGGHLAHIPTDRVHDVDMTVEEGVRSVITTGIAGPDDEQDDDVEPPTLEDLQNAQPVQRLRRDDE